MQLNIQKYASTTAVNCKQGRIGTIYNFTGYISFNWKHHHSLCQLYNKAGC